MRIKCKIQGGVLPTVVVVSLLMLIGVLGLFALWEQEMLLFARSRRIRQARADVESAYAFFRMYPGIADTLREGVLQLYDSLPGSRVRLYAGAWGLYDAVRVVTADSLAASCRLYGAEPDTENTLYYADSRSAVTLAGRTELKGTLHLPQNGLVYGRMKTDFYNGPEVTRLRIHRAGGTIPRPEAHAEARVTRIFDEGAGYSFTPPPENFYKSFAADSVTVFRTEDMLICGCTLRGKIILYGHELRIDSTCRLEHVLVCARKVIVEEGVHATIQVFARDTVLIGKNAVLDYPSGLYAGQYVEVGEYAEVNGYVIVRDTVQRKKMTANYRQARTARVRGLLWVDGTAQVQGIVAGCMKLRQAVYFSPQGYYKDMLYDVTLLENPVTAQPLWLMPGRRKEAVCVEK